MMTSQPRFRDLSDERPARVPFKTVLASIVGLWLCYFLLFTLRSELLDELLSHWVTGPELLWRRALASLAGIVMTIGLWLVLRLFDDRPLWIKITAALLLSLPVAVSLAQANHLIFLDINQRMAEQRAQQEEGQAPGKDGGADAGGDILTEMPGRQGATPSTPAPGRPTAKQDDLLNMIDLSFSRYFLVLAWCALYLALLTGEKARAAERRAGEFRRAAKAAELRSLRYQVNPHFLFNTLNSLSALVLTGRNEDAERMIQTLSTFYRRSLADDPTGDVPLADEFKLQRLYLSIEAVRFPERLRARYELPDALADVAVPGMILQPLVENSVKHAVAPSHDPVTITIAAREEYGRLVVSVADDGNGGAEGRARTGHSIGLANVRQRLEARFGEEASMVSGLAENGYVTLIRLPIVRMREERR